MDRRFEDEFYRSEWQRVLPLGPDGIQPYVHLARSSPLPGLQAALGRLIATLGRTVQGVSAIGRFAGIGMAKPPMLVATGSRAGRPRSSLRLAHGAARPAPRQAAAPRGRARAA